MGHRKGVVAFLILAFGLAWVSWEIPLRMGVPIGSTLFQLCALPGAFAPAVAAILVRVFVTREGFADAGLKLPWRQWRYFLFGLLLPIPVVLVIVLEVLGLRLAQPDFSLVGAVRESTAAQALASWAAHGANATPVMLNLVLIGQLLVTAIICTPLLWGEEFGWRGYLQPRLFPGRPVLAAAVVGLIWGVWHYPLILRGYDYGDDVALGSVVFLVSTALIAFIFAWLVERTGSIWSSSLAHSATNVIGGGLSALWLSGAHHPAVTSYAGLLAWPPLLVVCWGMWMLNRRRMVGLTSRGSACDTARPGTHAG